MKVLQFEGRIIISSELDVFFIKHFLSKYIPPKHIHTHFINSLTSVTQPLNQEE